MFSALALIILAYAGYYLIIQQRNEERLIDKAQRDLIQIVSNIKEKEKAYWKNEYYKNIFGNFNDSLIDSGNSYKEFRKKNLTLLDSIVTLHKSDNKNRIFRKIIDTAYAKNYQTLFLEEENLRDFILPLFKYNCFENHIFFTSKNATVISDFKTKINIEYQSFIDSLRKTSAKEPYSKIKVNFKNYYVFLLPVDLLAEKEAYIAGLISEKSFKKEKKESDLWLIIVFSFLIVIVIINYPLLKLWLRNEFERLDFIHILSSAISLVFGSSFILLLTLGLTSLLSLKEEKKQQLNKLNEEVDSIFKNELKDAYELLSFADDFKNLDSPQTFFDTIKLYNKYNFFKDVYWIDSLGIELHEINTEDTTPTLIELGARTYFKEKDQWLLPGESEIEDPKRFRFESIISWTTKEKKMAISKPSRRHQKFQSYKSNQADFVNSKVVALTTFPYSVMNTILPKYFSFCIITSNGDVLYHHDISKNFEENLLNETHENKYLQAAMDARVREHFNLKYHGEDFYAYISPVEGLPLHIITMYNLKEQRYYHSMIISTSLILLSIFAFILLVYLFFVYLINKLVYNKQVLDAPSSYLLHWMVPKKKNYSKYIQLIISTFVVIVSLILYSSKEKEPINLLFYFLVVEIIVFNHLAFSLKNLSNSDLFKKKYAAYLYSSVFSILILLSIYSRYFDVLELTGKFFTFILIYLTVNYLVKLFFEKEIDRKNSKGEKEVKNFKFIYFSFLFLWLFSLSIAPSIFIYNAVLKKEQKFYALGQRQFIKDELIKKSKTIGKNYSGHYYYPTKQLADSLILKGNYFSLVVDSIRLNPKKTDCALLHCSEIDTPDIWNNPKTLYERIRPLLSGSSEMYKFFSYLIDSNIDSCECRAQLFQYKYGFNNQDSYQQAIIYFSEIDKYFNWFYKSKFFVIPVILIVCGLCIIYYLLIRYTTLNIFIFDRFNAKSNLTTSEFLTKLRENKLPDYIFLINPSQVVIDSSCESHMQKIDFKEFCNNNNIQHSIKSDCKYLFITNFNIYWSNRKHLTKFIKSVKYIIEETKLKIIISSVLSPKQINIFYDQEENSNTSKLKLKSHFNNTNLSIETPQYLLK